MAIQFPDFQRISFDEANPWLEGAERSQQMMKLSQQMMQSGQMFPQDLQAKILANQIAKVQAKYAEPVAQADLQKTNLFNKYYGRDIESQIGLRGSQGQNLEAETKKINYMLQHPGFMGGDETKSMEALRQMGLVDSHYQPKDNSSSAQQNSLGGYTPIQSGSPSQQLGGYTPIAGGNPQQQYAQAQDIANSVVRQQKNMNIPESQKAGQFISQPLDFSTTQPTTGFNVNSLVQALVNKPMTDLQYKQTLTRVMQQNLAGKAYNSMPSVEKEYAISQARAMGYTGEQASRMFNQGYDLASMAQSKGYDGSNPSSWPIARGAPTTAIQTRIERANSTLAALDAVEPSLASAYSLYMPRFHGVNPSLIKDMMTGENADQQAEAFAAYALYPEIQALRINAQGGKVGEGAIQHMADASFARLNTLGLSPNGLVYQKTMKRVGQLIKQMNKAENSAIYKQGNDQFDQDDKANTVGGNYNFTNTSMDDLMKIVGGQ